MPSKLGCLSVAVSHPCAKKMAQGWASQYSRLAEKGKCGG
jgi:hypothetical protein